MTPHRVVAGALSLMVAVLALGVGVGGASAAQAASCEQLADDMPCLVFSPASGGPGTFVTFSGYVDRDDLKEWEQNFRASELHGMYRDFPDGGPTGDACELIVALRGFHADLNTTTRKISGSFTIGSSGNCNQTLRSYPAYPGMYNLTAGCVSCVFAEYRVTAATLPATGADTTGLVALGLGLCLAGGCVIAAVSAAPTPDAVNAAR